MATATAQGRAQSRANIPNPLSSEVWGKLSHEQQQMLLKFWSGPELSMEPITPEMAELLLLTSPGNRKTSESNLAKISRDMYNGVFHPGNDAMLIDTLNQLRNAHHRLLAIIDTGKAQRLMVRRHVPDEEIPVIDQGYKRNTQAATYFLPGFAEKFEGLEAGKDGGVVRIAVSSGWTNKSLVEGFGVHGMADALLHFKDNLSFIRGIVGYKRNKTTPASVLAVFVRAHKSGVEESKLTYALNFLMDGGSSITHGEVERLPGTDSLAALRDWLLRTSSDGFKLYAKIYFTTQTMLYNFLRGIERNRISTEEVERWPLDLSAIIPDDPPYKKQQRKLGKDNVLRIKEWAKNQSNGAAFKLKHLVEAVLGGADDTKRRNLALKLSKIIKEFGEIELPGVGSLKPTTEVKKRVSAVVLRK